MTLPASSQPSRSRSSSTRLRPSQWMPVVPVRRGLIRIGNCAEYVVFGAAPNFPRSFPPKFVHVRKGYTTIICGDPSSARADIRHLCRCRPMPQDVISPHVAFDKEGGIRIGDPELAALLGEQ